MNKRIFSLFTVVVLAFMAACSGNTENTEKPVPPAGQETPSTEEPSSPAGEKPTQDNGKEPVQDSNSGNEPAGNADGTNPDLFKSGLFIDWNGVDDPLINESLKAALQAFLIAVTKPDEASYEKIFPNHATEDRADFRNVLKEPMNYQFDKVGKAIKEDGRILVPVSGTSRDDVFGIRDFSNNLYFKQNAQNEWEVIMID
ncbi:hypothetical protein [Paenibacillus jiagnxiensis]|uniref:hypothetical protein n=1 Tax=Paenibacillus jiagnxiensis TaxID=3228926 RepID=UPI0033BB684E